MLLFFLSVLYVYFLIHLGGKMEWDKEMKEVSHGFSHAKKMLKTISILDQIPEDNH